MAGGGSGGHITPLLSLAQETKQLRPNAKIIYIGHRGENFSGLINRRLFDGSYSITAGKFRRYPINPITLFKNIFDLFKVLVGVVQAIKLIGKLRPDVLFSKGGFVALPMGIAAKIRGIPIVTHDSDSVPGLTNRILSGWAAVNATGLPPQFYSYKKEKIRYTGVPIDSRYDKPLSKQAIEKEIIKQGATPGSQVLLVMGGSLGAKSINTSIPLIADKLLEIFPKLFIIHIAGNKSEVTTKQDYSSSVASQEHQRRIKVLGLSNELYKLIDVAKLVVTRAGATSLAELAAAAKPSVVVPSPFVSAGQQLLNAKFYAEQGSICIIDNNAESNQWFKIISGLLKDNNKLNKLSKNIHKLAKKDSSKELSNLLISIAEKG